ncbi:MAG TPA: TldD/PmbA family protein [Candidatus Dormibacteraeota bacterium]|nr:TldD/PmbA family protein [Candidatus Dormibacteraeota bacterium]
MSPLADRLLSRASTRGADEAEVYISTGTEFTVQVYKGEIESLVSAESRGVGLRTFREHRVGFSYTSALEPDALDHLVDEALENGRYNHAEDANVLPQPEDIQALPGLASAALRELDPQAKIDFALEMERRATSLDPHVKRVSKAIYSDGRGRVEIYNTRGLDAAYERTVAYGVLDTIAEQDSEMQSGFAFTHGRDIDDLDLDGVVREAVENAAGLLGAKPVPTASVPVVFHPHAAAMILGVLSSSFSADAVIKRRSLLAGKIEQQVASAIVTVTDDPTLPEGLASRPFDGEGVPSQRNALVAGGVLKSYLHNTYTAMRTRSRSTGSAVRSYKSVPEVGVSNLVLKPGELSREGLLARVDNGLHVEQLSGLNTVNPVSGEFSLGLTGHWIEKGQLTRPVKELTVAGNVIELLKKVAAVASDTRFVFAGGFIGSPTVLVEELPVGGL